MPVEITMPQLSDTMSEGVLVKWLKKEGDKVKAGEIIAEVETDKATMEMEAFEGGTVAAQVLAEGGKVAVGGLMAVLAKTGENAADVKKQYASGGGAASGATSPASAAAQAPAVEKKAVAASEQTKAAPAPAAKVASAAPTTAGAKPAASAAPAKAAASGGPESPQFAATATMEAASAGEIHDLTDNLHGATREDINTDPAAREDEAANGDGSRIKASPLARRMAEEAGISLRQIHGSGPGGRIVQADVIAAQHAAQSAGQSAPAPRGAPAAAPAKAAELPPIRTAGTTQVVPFTKMRAAIASALQKSKQNLPHYYEKVDIELDDVLKLRELMNQRLEKENVRLSLSDFIMKAVAFALTQNPVLNSRFNSEKNEVTRYTDVNLGTAVAIPDGLIVPVLRGVDRMGLKEIRLRSADLIERARAQRLRREEQTEGTFTISSLGSMGVKEYTAIINPPEVGILAVGAAEKRAIVRGDEIMARTVMTVTLSVDHRVVDGAVAAAFLASLKSTLEQPALMLM